MMAGIALVAGNYRRGTRASPRGAITVVLDFASEPDQVFHTITTESLKVAISVCSVLPSDDYRLSKGAKREATRCYRQRFPNAYKLFTRADARQVCELLLEAHVDETTLYYLTDYHWLVLHDVLLSFCVEHSDAPEDYPKVGPYRLGPLDFDTMVDVFFWDLDFLIPEILEVTAAKREQAGVSQEAWGIAAGLKPHPDELRLTPCESPSPCLPRPGPRAGCLSRYPPLRRYGNDTQSIGKRLGRDSWKARTTCDTPTVL
jgi:hypothetical protein